MVEPEIALVFSADPWVETLHRHCSDHGGARLRQLLVDPVLALDEDYSTLVTGHRWPALTAELVGELHRHGRTVLGVWDRTEPDSRALLEGVGVDGLIASDASPREIVEAITALPGATDIRTAAVDGGARAARGGRRIVVGGPAGAGSTEIAIGLASALCALGRRTVLVDADDIAPAVAPRLGLPVEPNIGNAVDAVEHHAGVVADAIMHFDRLDVVSGFPAPSGWIPLRPPEVLRVVHALALEYPWIVLDTAAPGPSAGAHGAGARSDLARAVIGDADVLVGVAAPTPVGIARFIAWLALVLPCAPDAALHVVVNRAPTAAFRRGELQAEILGVVRPDALAFVPDDARVADAAWSGSVVRRGRFARALRDIAAALATPTPVVPALEAAS